MKTVAIVGAGPGGLVAAKTLLRAQSGSAFRVTVFERNSRIGGIWALDEHSTTEGFLINNTPTNLSKYTVAFSDLSWDSVDCTSSLHSPTQTNGNGSATGKPGHGRGASPMFPKAWQAGRYLTTYAKRYIPDGVIELQKEVKHTRRIVDGQRATWEVTTSDTAGEQTRLFDHLIIASGFFSKPRVLPHDLNPYRDDPSPPVKIIHSSQFRTLSDLFPAGADAADKKILIFGGGNSAGETAGTVALALSSAVHTSKAGSDRFAGCHLRHVTPRPFTAIPPFVPAKDGGFLPLDVTFYDLATRPPDEIIARAGRMPPELIKIMLAKMQEFVGGDQSDLGADALVAKGSWAERAPQAALTDNYAEFVRSGDIKPVAGRVAKLEAQTPTSLRALVTHPTGDFWIDDVAAVVHATGYTPASALAFLPAEILEQLEYAPDAPRLPLVLDATQTGHRALPDLAFIGFYEGPYWGVMEMQARLIARRWTLAAATPERPWESPSELRALRASMAAREPDVPQYWLGDYLAHMEHLARDLELTRNDAPFAGPRAGVAAPARYLDPAAATDEETAREARTAMHALAATVDGARTGAFVPRAALRAMQGRWRVSRRIDSAVGAYPSGTFEGIARLHPRAPTTAPAGEPPFDLELLYVEQGAFAADAGPSMRAARRYVYRWREADDALSVWFVRDDGLSVDYFFHGLAFSAPRGGGGDGAFTATGEHLCVEDMYRTRYDLQFRGVALEHFAITHSVTGPKKDYVASARYEREEPGTKKGRG